MIEEVWYEPPNTGKPVAAVYDRPAVDERRSQSAATTGRVWINDRQYIKGVPESAWTFPIGGYLPAQKWLKDPAGRTLGHDEREEYCRIIWAVLETQRLMAEIDKAIEAHGGWPLK